MKYVFYNGKLHETVERKENGQVVIKPLDGYTTITIDTAGLTKKPKKDTRLH